MAFRLFCCRTKTLHDFEMKDHKSLSMLGFDDDVIGTIIPAGYHMLQTNLIVVAFARSTQELQQECGIVTANKTELVMRLRNPEIGKTSRAIRIFLPKFGITFDTLHTECSFTAKSDPCNPTDFADKMGIIDYHGTSTIALVSHSAWRLEQLSSYFGLPGKFDVACGWSCAIQLAVLKKPDLNISVRPFSNYETVGFISALLAQAQETNRNLEAELAVKNNEIEDLKRRIGCDVFGSLPDAKLKQLKFQTEKDFDNPEDIMCFEDSNCSVLMSKRAVEDAFRRSRMPVNALNKLLLAHFTSKALNCCTWKGGNKHDEHAKLHGTMVSAIFCLIRNHAWKVRRNKDLKKYWNLLTTNPNTLGNKIINIKKKLNDIEKCSTKQC